MDRHRPACADGLAILRRNEKERPTYDRSAVSALGRGCLVFVEVFFELFANGLAELRSGIRLNHEMVTASAPLNHGTRTDQS